LPLEAVAIGANLTKESEIAKPFQRNEEAIYGRVDIRVNNAGVVGFAPLEGITTEEFHRIYDVNVLGNLLAATLTCRAFAKCDVQNNMQISLESNWTR
jgi:3-oxoacyl-[acyl-carrier protein] reductase